MNNTLRLLQREHEFLAPKQKAVAKLIRLYKRKSILPITNGTILDLEVSKELQQDSVVLPGYPYDSKWPRKILFALQHESEPVSTQQLIKLISAYESGTPPEAINKAIRNNYPLLVAKNKIALTEQGPDRKYYIPREVKP
ncbi:MAG: hypothetical protein KF862_04165 [Chitinophagaceae bacterium]|nr:hypothetical protein [Chitinophagaceae bacterium]